MTDVDELIAAVEAAERKYAAVEAMLKSAELELSQAMNRLDEAHCEQDHDDRPEDRALDQERS